MQSTDDVRALAFDSSAADVLRQAGQPSSGERLLVERVVANRASVVYVCSTASPIANDTTNEKQIHSVAYDLARVFSRLQSNEEKPGKLVKASLRALLKADHYDLLGRAAATSRASAARPRRS